MNKLANPKTFSFHFFRKLSEHWGFYIGFHKSYYLRAIEFNWKIRFNGSHRGLSIWILIWNRYLEIELNDNRHTDDYPESGKEEE